MNLSMKTCYVKELGNFDDGEDGIAAINSAPDNIRTVVNYGSGRSKYRPIVKPASTEYGRFLVGTVRRFR